MGSSASLMRRDRARRRARTGRCTRRRFSRRHRLVRADHLQLRRGRSGAPARGPAPLVAPRCRSAAPPTVAPGSSWRARGRTSMPRRAPARPTRCASSGSGSATPARLSASATAAAACRSSAVRGVACRPVFGSTSTTDVLVVEVRLHPGRLLEALGSRSGGPPRAPRTPAVDSFSVIRQLEELRGREVLPRPTRARELASSPPTLAAVTSKRSGPIGCVSPNFWIVTLSGSDSLAHA